MLEFKVTIWVKETPSVKAMNMAIYNDSLCELNQIYVTTLFYMISQWWNRDDMSDFLVARQMVLTRTMMRQIANAYING